jgi:hypothetical protein
MSSDGLAINHCNRSSRHTPGRTPALVTIFTLALLAFGEACPGQEQPVELTSFHTWTDFTSITRIRDGFYYDGDYGVRGLLTDPNWALLYARPSCRFRLRSNVLAHGGIGVFYNILSDADDLLELRPWAGLRVAGPRLGGFQFSNYFRGERRSFRLEGESSWDGAWRGRWQLQVVSPHFSMARMDDFYGLTSAEVFMDFGSTVENSFGDRFRYSLGIGRDFQSLAVEVVCLLHRIRAIGSEGRSFETDDVALRLRVFYSFDTSITDEDVAH